MDIRLTAFASELTKLAEAGETKRKSYLSQMAAAAPFAAASAVADVPKGWVDESVNRAVRGTPGKGAWKTGLGRGAGRLGAGLVTSPMFLSGVRDLRSDDAKERRKGYAKVLASGVTFSALKGGIEAGFKESGQGRAHVFKSIKNLAKARGIVGLGSAALTAKTIASATKQPKDGKKSLWRQYGMPAVVGAASGAGEGALEEALELGRKATRRGIAARAAGRAAAGALGAVALTEAARRLTPKVKTAEVPPNFGPSSGELYDQVRGWAHDKNDVDIYAFYKDIRAQGERSPSRRAAYYALTDELQHRGHRVPEPQMRDRVAGKQVRSPTAADTAALALVAASPAVAVAAASQMEPDDRDRVLSDALDRQFIQGRMERVETAPGGEAFERQLVDGRMRKRIHLPGRGKELPGVVAHELGHSTMGRVREKLVTPGMHNARYFGMAASLALPLLAVEGVNDRSFTTPEDLESRARLVKNVGLVAGLAQAPVLAEEALANVNAVRLLQRAGATQQEALLKVLKQAGPGFSTYAVPALFPFLVARHLRRKARKSDVA